ncbi:MAG: glutathione S-transferase [Pseudomonadota bacterium]
MKLFHAAASPYVRKVMVTLHETGQVDQVETVPGATTPLDPNPVLLEQNPLGRIPALVTEDAGTLFDSRVICRYLNARAGAGLYGTGGAEFPIIGREALAEGMIDSCLLTVYEGRLRPEEKVHQPYIDGQLGKVRRAMAAFNARIGEMSGDLTIDKIALGCGIGYADFRLPDLGWRDDNPALAEWYAAFADRPSMQATIPAG